MKVYVVGLLHPAFIIRGNHQEEPAQVQYLKRIREIAQNGWQVLDPSIPPRGAILSPSLADLRSWESAGLSGGVSVDIETAGRRLRGVGFCRVADLVPIWVPLCGQGGTPPNYGNSGTDDAGGADVEQSVRAWLRELLANPKIPKWFHNGLFFDIPLLRHNGFEVKGYAGDTLLAHHIAYPEMRKGLAYLSNLYLGAGRWKQLVNEGDEGEDK